MTRAVEKVFYDTLARAEDKTGVSFDPNSYEKYAELDLNLSDLRTPATGVSLAGFEMVRRGRKDLSIVSNIHLLALGRGFDMLDGSIARFMNQSSDAGAALDVTLDKLEMAMIASAAWKQDALPKSFIGYVAATNCLHAGLTTAAAIQHPGESFRPPKSGKYSMFGSNLGGGLLLYANAYEKEHPELERHDALRKAGFGVIAAGVAAEVPAIGTYLKRLSKTTNLQSSPRPSRKTGKIMPLIRRTERSYQDSTAA